MTRRWAVVLAFLLGIAGAAPVWACTLITPAYQDELHFQQGLWRDSDAVFLARATPVEESQSRLVPVISLHGRSPPRQSVAKVNVNCGETPSRGVVIAFARRIRVSDTPWEPWRWGSWYVIGHLTPAEVVDPKMVEALRQASGRLEN